MIYIKSYERVGAIIKSLEVGVPTEVDLMEFTPQQWRRKIPCNLRVKTKIVDGRLIVTRYDDGTSEDYVTHVKEVLIMGGGALRPRLKAELLVERAAREIGVKVKYNAKKNTVRIIYEKKKKPEREIPCLFDIDKWE